MEEKTERVYGVLGERGRGRGVSGGAAAGAQCEQGVAADARSPDSGNDDVLSAPVSTKSPVRQLQLLTSPNTPHPTPPRLR